MNDQISCGIDFGTSNSTCAVYNGSTVELVPLDNENPVLPSALFFANDGEILFGKEAIAWYIDGEEGRLLRGLKSILGTSLMAERTVVGKKSRKFEDILSIYIGNLKNKAESFLGQSLENIVMGRPVHFHDKNPDADKKSEEILQKIANKIGFKGVQFQYEPIAAAYAHERKVENESVALVVDLGGGTSDFTVIRLSPERSTKPDRKDDILATAGIRVGGTNFDKRLSLASFMPYLGLGTQYHTEFDKNEILDMPPRVYHNLSDWPLIHQAQSPAAIREARTLLRTSLEPQKVQRLLDLQEKKLGHAFLQSVEQTKISLTSVDEYTSHFNSLGYNFIVKTDKDTFLSSIQTQIDRIDGCADECLTQSGCSQSDIDLVILTGGSSELPVINNMVRSKFPNAQILKEDKFGSVGRGLAYNASQIYTT